jgi:hypothetical protein
MSDQDLFYLPQKKFAELKKNVFANIEAYRKDGFGDKGADPSWGIKLDFKADLTPLADLVPGTGGDNEVANSLLVWRALHKITPSLATEKRFWARLSHVECFKYSQGRWLNLKKDDADLKSLIDAHFFAESLTRYRDDHSIGRLWWNAHVAKTLMPNEQEKALKLLLRKAEFRSNLVERPMLFERQKIARAILKKMDNTPDVCKTEEGFRTFIKQVNKLGGGIVFEAYSELECQLFLDKCWNTAASLMKKN